MNEGTNDALQLGLDGLQKLQGALDATAAKTLGGAPGPLQQPWTPTLVITLSVTVFVFGLIICALMTNLHMRGKSATDLLRLFSLPLIIVSAVILVIAGYSDQQISSVIGLLGTMAGYLLGSRGSTSSAEENQRPGGQAGGVAARKDSNEMNEKANALPGIGK